MSKPFSKNHRLPGWSRLWPLLLPPLLLAPSLGSFPYPSAEAPYSDLAITHYTNAIYLLRSVREWHTVPLWSPTILSGYPFVANPLSGLWYPPGWLALLLPLPFGFNLLVAMHLLWAGAGMYRLLRQEGLGHPAALFGALAFAGMPKLFAHYGAGHLTLLYAVAWTPWLLGTVQGPWLKVTGGGEQDSGRRSSFNLGPAIILALIFMADVRWAPLAGAAWWGYTLAHSQVGWKIFSLKWCLRQSILAALLCAPLAFPLLEYSTMSTRASLAPEEVLTFSLPFARLLGLVFPDLGGYHEWALYPGAMVILLALSAGLNRGSVQRESRDFWKRLAAATLLVSLGSQVPLFSHLAQLPGIDLMRVPTRALFLTGLALAALAAHGLDVYWSQRDSPEIRRSILCFVGIASFALALAGGAWVSVGALPRSFAWGTAAVLAGSAWIWAGWRLAGIIPAQVWWAGFWLFGLLDLGGVDRAAFAGREPEAVLSEGAAAAAYLMGQPGSFRSYSPSYSLPQQTAGRFGLELSEGVDPLQLETYAAYMESAGGVPRQGYSVTLPSFSAGDPKSANAGYPPDPERLGWLNVRFVVSDFELPTAGLVLRARFDETRVYENLKFLPRAWVQPAGSVPGEPVKAANRVLWRPNSIEVVADGPGLLVVAEIAYPGWRAWVDGQEGEIQPVAGILRGVAIGPGQHTVLFMYRPASLYAGCLLFVAGCAWLGMDCLARRRSLRRVAMARPVGKMAG